MAKCIGCDQEKGHAKNCPEAELSQLLKSIGDKKPTTQQQERIAQLQRRTGANIGVW